MLVAIRIALVAAPVGAALVLRPPHRPTHLQLGAAQALVIPGALWTMLSLLVPTAGWQLAAIAGASATATALWVLRAAQAASGDEGRGGGGGGGPHGPVDGPDPTGGLEIDWAAFERDALAAWQDHRDRERVGV